MHPDSMCAEDTRLLIELRDLERSREWGRLEACANQILAQCPISVLALMGLGKALEKQGKANEAVECYENAIAVLRTRRTPHAHFMKRLDILYRRLKKYEDCFQVCLYYVGTHSYSADAFHRLARASHLIGQKDLKGVAEALETRLREPVKPRGHPLPLLSDEELENLAKTTPDDIQRAIDEWDERFPELAGMLDATPYTGDIDDLESSWELEEEEADFGLEAEPRPRYSSDDIERICKELSERLQRYGG